jgi:Secretion system C-terminal sorting domain
MHASSSVKKADRVIGENNGTTPEINSNWTGTVWRRPLSEMITAVKDKGGNAPERFSLFRNYPNPFNPSTVIKYRLSTAGQVTLKIYDVLGRELTTLVSSHQAAGNHSVTFDGSSLASGVYLCRLESSSYTATMKLLLLK